MRRVVLIVILLATPAVLPGSGHADRTRDAREEFALGRRAWDEARFEDAIKHYQRAMELKYSPLLHYNIGLAYEKLDQPANALTEFRRYLKAEPHARNKAEVRRRISELEHRVAAPPATAPTPAPKPATPAPKPATPAPTPRPAAPRPRPIVLPPGPITPAPALPLPVAPAGEGRRNVIVYFLSSPERAEVLVDGHFLGTTPLRLAMAEGVYYQVGMSKRGHLAQSASVLAREGEIVQLALTRAPGFRESSMTRTEWFGLVTELGSQSGSFVVALRLQVFGLRWRRFFWSILDLGGGGGANKTAAVDLSTRVGYPFYLGERGAHQLRLGAGLGFGAVQSRAVVGGYSTTVDNGGFLFSPSVEYRYQTRGSFFIGVGLRYAVSTGNLQGLGTPQAILIGLPLGWAARE